jgi:hypothetical protein
MARKAPDGRGDAEAGAGPAVLPTMAAAIAAPHISDPIFLRAFMFARLFDGLLHGPVDGRFHCARRPLSDVGVCMECAGRCAAIGIFAPSSRVASCRKWFLTC